MATRIGCCINMLCGNQDEKAMRYIDELAQIGYDYLELPLTQIMELTDVEFSIMRDDIDKKNIGCWVCNDFFPASIKITGPNIDLQKIDDYLDTALRRAKALGAQIIVFGSGGARCVPAGFPKDEAFRQLVGFLRTVSKKIKSHGMIIAIEPLNREECNIINSIDEAFELCRAVNADNVQILADYYHMFKENEDIDIMSGEKKCRLIHAHVSDPRKGRLFPTDARTHRAFLDKVKECRVGTISVEGYTANFGQDARKSLELLKNALN